jgi:hypothetical protein
MPGEKLTDVNSLAAHQSVFGATLREFLTDVASAKITSVNFWRVCRLSLPCHHNGTVKGTKPNKPALLLFAIGHVAVTAITWADLKRRPAEQIRGDKLVWRVLTALNTGNSVLYWLLGRRRPTQGSSPKIE